MKGVVRRFKQSMVLFLILSVILSSATPVFASSVEVREWDFIPDANSQGYKYTTGRLDVDRRPFISYDGSLVLNRIATEPMDNGFNVQLKPTAMDKSIERFIRASEFMQRAYACKQLVDDGVLVDTLPDSTITDTSLIWDNDQCYYSGYVGYNTYAFRDWDDDWDDTAFEGLTGEALAKAEFELYLSDLKSIGWKEFNDAIDSVYSSLDFTALYNSTTVKYVHVILCPFVDDVISELKSSGAIVQSPSCPYKYAVKKFTYCGTEEVTPSVSDWEYSEENSSWNEVSVPYGDYVSNLEDGARQGFVISEYSGLSTLNGSGRNYWSGDNFVPGDGFSLYRYDDETFTFHSRLNDYTDTKFESTKATIFGQLAYDADTLDSPSWPYCGYGKADLENTHVILFDIMYVYPVTVPTTTTDYITRATVNDLKVGDILAPGALIINTFDVENDVFNYASFYAGIPSDSDGKYSLYHYLGDYGIDEYGIDYNSDSGYVRAYDSEYGNSDEFTEFLDDSGVLDSELTMYNTPAAADVGYVYGADANAERYSFVLDSYGDTGSEFRVFTDKSLDSDAHILEYSGYDSEHSVYISVKFRLTEDNKLQIHSDDAFELSVKSENPVFGSYARVVDKSFEYIRGYEDSVPRSPGVANGMESLNSIVSYYGSRVCREDGVTGYKIISISTSDFDATADDYDRYASVAGDSYYQHKDYSEHNRNILIEVEPLRDTPSSEYIVDFDSNGGSDVPSQTVLGGGYATEPSDPTYEGHDFIGWCSDEDLQVPYDFATPVTDNMTLYAHWELKDCTVTFNPLGGTPVPSQTVKYGEKIVRPDTTKTGYHVEDWRVGSVTGEIYDFDTPVTGSFTLFADWGKNSYTVTVNKGEGIESVTGGGTYLYDDPVTLGYTLLSGYDFTGWSGDKYVGEFNMPAGDVTVTANAVLKQYTISFNGNGATSGSMSPQLKTHGVAVTLSQNSFVKTGHDFTGWNTDADGNGQSFADKSQYSLDGNQTLYAQWDKKNYTVSFNTQGGTSVDSQTVEYGGTVSRPETTKTGYHINSWRIGSVTGAVYNFDSPVTSDMVLFADWGRNTYTVTVNKGTGVASVSGSGNYLYGDTVILGYTMMTGYAFTGWTGDKDTGEFTMPAGDVEVTANGALMTYHILYDGNGADMGAMSAQTKTHGVPVVLSNNEFVRTGYGFTGWNTKSDGTGLSYSAGSSYNVDGEVTMYAQWNLSDCTITFNPLGGTPVPSQTVKYGEKIVEPDTTKTGYHVENWRVGSVTGEIYDFDTPVTGSFTLFADWGKNSYTVTVNKGDGIASVIGGGIYLYEDSVVLGYTLQDGYEFSGWTGDKTTGTFVMPANDVTVTANAVLKQYTISFDGNGSTGGSMSSLTKTHGTPVTLSQNSFIRTGHDFTGWNTKADGSGQSYSDKAIYAGNADVTLYAQWTLSDCTITFNPLGGTPVPSQTVKYGEKIVEPDTTKTGYHVENWCVGSVTGEIYDFDTPVTGSFTLFADWGKNSYTVTVNKGDGIESVTGGGTYLYEDFVVLGYTLQDGYEFSGWTGDKTTGTFVMPSNDVTVMANAVLSQYHISFDGNGSTGGSMSSLPKAHGTPVTLSPNSFVRTGYNFTGWNTKADGSGQSYSDKAVYAGNADVTLYAQWTLSDCTITFNPLGGTPVPSQTVKYGEKIVKPDTTKTGHHVENWRVGSVTGEIYDFDTPVTGSFTLFADWDKNSYTVTVNKGEGIESVTGGGIYLYEDSVTLGYTLQDGYEFSGWTGDKTTGTFVMPANDVTVMANAVLSQYHVSFDGNGSTGGSMSSLPKAHGTPVTLSPNSFVRTGYNFTGWNTKADGSGQSYSDKAVYAGNADVTLYAQWTLSDCTITFNPLGGTPVPSQTVKYGEKIVEPDTTKTGHHVENWRVGSVTGEIYDFDTPVTGSFTLFADWGKNSYTVTVNKGEGIESVTGGGVYLYGDSVVLGYTVEDGYAFDGWTGDEDTGEFVMPANDVTVTAHAARKIYHVIYDGNGADSGAMAAQTKAHDIPIILSDNEFNREHYVFVGWNTESDGSGVDYDEGDEYNGNGETIMYAQWSLAGDLVYQKKLSNDSSYAFEWNNGINYLKNVLYQPKDDVYLHTDNYWTAVMSVDDLDFDDAVSGFEDKLPMPGNHSFCFAVDICLDKYISSDEDITDVLDSTHFRDLRQPMSITFNGTDLVPDGCTFDKCVVYRIHKDFVSQLDSVVDPDHDSVTFESDGFSTYLLYCDWSCKVKFESNGGSPVPSQTVGYGDFAVMPDIPEKEGVSFAGWYTDVDLLSLYDFNKPVISDMVLYAKWCPPCRVTFDADGGSPVPDDQIVVYGLSAVKPSKAPSKPDYVFVGWYLGDSVYDFSKPVVSDINLVAKYKFVDVYHVVLFDVNGGDKTPAGQKVLDGGKVVRPFNPSKEGYTFVYWDYAGSKYNFDNPVYEDMVLTAVYEKNKDKKKEKDSGPVVYQTPYQNPVMFMPNSGTVVISPSSLSAGSSMKYDAVQTGIAPFNLWDWFVQ